MWEYFPKETVGKQLVKAADSIGANIAEGTGRGMPKDNQRFIRIARGSYNETKYWLRRAFKRNMVDEVQAENLNKIIDDLGPSINAYLKSIGGKKEKQPNTKH